jgi:hypothetical protein
VALLEQGFSQGQVALGQLGVERERTIEGIHRLRNLPPRMQGLAKAAIRFGQLRIQSNGAAVGSFRPLGLPLTAQGVTSCSST